MQLFHDKVRIRRHWQAFTLVELMVATAVLSLLLLMLAQAASMLGNTWASGNGRAERRQSGRALVDFIGQEIRAAALPVDLSVVAGTPDLQFIVNPPSISDEFCQPSAVFWQAPLATDASLGNMAVLGYFVRWTTDTGNQTPRASLCRVFINPSLGGQPPQENPNYRIYTHENNWITDAILDDVALADYDSGYAGLFAENVIGFWVRCLDKSGLPIAQTGIIADYDSRVTYTGKGYDGTGTLVQTTYPAPVLPNSVEISLVLLDSRAATEITTGNMGVIKSEVAKAGTQSSKPPADYFTESMQGNPAMKRLIQGMSAHSMRVYLENAP